MKTTGSVTIDRPIDEVFERTLANVALWSEIVVDDYVVEDVNNQGVGTRFHTTTEDRGRRMDFEGVVTDHNPPNRHQIEMTGTHFGMKVDYQFERVSSQRTKVTQYSDVQGFGLTRVVFLLCGWMFRRSSCQAVQKELENLKRYCEDR
ncbi:MAG: SRPBCC family protein [Planctomycetota bacterium]